jgi:SOS-response transcriptional repressor LexA
MNRCAIVSSHFRLSCIQNTQERPLAYPSLELRSESILGHSENESRARCLGVVNFTLNPDQGPIAMTIPYHLRESKRLGRTAEGPLIETLEGQETIPVPQALLSRNNICVLQVCGDSMIGDHLLGGDHLIVEKRDTARDGEMVVALTNKGEVTLKRFLRDGPRIRLEPPDASAEATVFDEKDVTIQGVVVGILRKYSG